jgi:hypothetical protein
MSFTAHFHGGPRDGRSRRLDVDHPQVDIYLDPEEEGDEPIDPLPVQPGEPYPTIPNDHYVLRSGSIADGVHYDWTPDR